MRYETHSIEIKREVRVKHPELSIIIPTYKRPDKLRRALNSANRSAKADKEVIVIDDCHEGSGFLPAREHGARYFNKQGVDRGLSESRNIGLLLARGEFIAFLDDDDILNEDALDSMLEIARGAPAQGIVFGNHMIFNESSEHLVKMSGFGREQLLICNQIPVGSFLLRRSVIRSKFDTTLRSHEDWDFLLRNLQFTQLLYADVDVVRIDKSQQGEATMSGRRRQFFWMEFISIYSRFPAPELCEERAAMLQKLGISLNPKLLRFDDLV
jgi:glycosyltransferase involved in cell wall biosynthesis